MSEWDGPGAAGQAERGTGSPGENPREVAGAVTVALAALREAGEAFRRYEAHHAHQPALHGADKQERAEKAIENGRLAQLCGKAAADLEAALGVAFQQMANRVDRPKPKVLAEFTGFRAGWAARGSADEYLAKEEPEGQPPACTLEDALAVFRAQIAKDVA